jgi:hypothetical protein
VALSRSRGVGAVVLVVAVALGGSSAVLSSGGNAIGSVSTLTVVDGPVLVRHGPAEFTRAQKGDVLAAGDVVHTTTGASAEVTYFEGSSVRLEANTEIIVGSLRGSDVGVAQTLGRAWHVVTKLVRGDSRFEVRAPSLTASMRG